PPLIFSTPATEHPHSPPVFFTLPISPDKRFFFSLSLSQFDNASRRSLSNKTHSSQSTPVPRVAIRSFTRGKSSRSNLISNLNLPLEITQRRFLCVPRPVAGPARIRPQRRI